MKSTRIPDLYHWNVYQPDRRIDFNSFFWVSPEGGILVDPMPESEGGFAFVADQGGASYILITNRDHFREAALWKHVTGAKILAPRAESSDLGDRVGLVDEWFDAPADLPGPLSSLVRAFPLRGGKSPGEVALYLEATRTLIFGDAIRSHESGRFRLLPDDKIEDRSRLVDDIYALRDINADTYLLGDGDSFFWSGRSAFLDFLRDLSQ